MIRRHSSIYILFIGLITLSLSFSTVHSHSAIQASVHESNHPGIEHSIEKDTAFCPVCGILKEILIDTPVSGGLIDIEVERIAVPDQPWVQDTRPHKARGRSPPLEG